MQGIAILMAQNRPYAFDCPLCRMWSEVPGSVFGTELPCLHCSAQLKLNTFTINADWRPISEAWRRGEVSDILYRSVAS